MLISGESMMIILGTDLCIDFDDLEGDDDSKVEFPCPFCSEDFDIVGLCCHIDEEHPTESNYGVLFVFFFFVVVVVVITN